MLRLAARRGLLSEISSPLLTERFCVSQLLGAVMQVNLAMGREVEMWQNGGKLIEMQVRCTIPSFSTAQRCFVTELLHSCRRGEMLVDAEHSQAVSRSTAPVLFTGLRCLCWW